MQHAEDFYEVAPIEIEMVGGYCDGLRMHVPDNRDTWLMPIPADVSLHGLAGAMPGPSFNVQQYRSTGSIRDDGAQVFRAV